MSNLFKKLNEKISVDNTVKSATVLTEIDKKILENDLIFGNLMEELDSVVPEENEPEDINKTEVTKEVVVDEKPEKPEIKEITFSKTEDKLFGKSPVEVYVKCFISGDVSGLSDVEKNKYKMLLDNEIMLRCLNRLKDMIQTKKAENEKGMEILKNKIEAFVEKK